jgi:rhodanese-related sulfurtransferase
MTAVSSLACAAPAPALGAEHTSESLAAVKREFDAGRAVLVDVRERSECDAGYVQGAILLPLSGVKNGLSREELARLPKGKTLYTYCVVGKRALTVANTLESHQFPVKALKPGYQELIAAGFPPARP